MSNQKADFISVILNLKISLYLETDNNKTKKSCYSKVLNDLNYCGVTFLLLLIEKNKIHNKYIMKTPSYDAKNGLCVLSWPLKENNQLKTHARKPKGNYTLSLRKRPFGMSPFSFLFITPEMKKRRGSLPFILVKLYNKTNVTRTI